MTQPRHEVVHGDCREVLAERVGVAELAICDPPYNIGQSYDTHDDNMDPAEYLDFSRQWLQATVRALKKNGQLFVFAPDQWVSEIDVLCKRELGLYKQHHIIWAFTFGQAVTKGFPRSHCHLLHLLKTKSRWTFNDTGVRVPSARQARYKDKRANPKGKLPDDTWVLYKDELEKGLTGDLDTWLTSRICGTFHEREKYSPNQIPVVLMERLVRACSNPGELVLDPFAGTGSSGAAAAGLGRGYLGIDVSKTCVLAARRRIAGALPHEQQQQGEADGGGGSAEGAAGDPAAAAPKRGRRRGDPGKP